MKQALKLLTCLILLLTLHACSKGGGGGDSPTPEADLIVNLNPDPASAINQTLSSTYTFNVVVQSTMPAQGVTIKTDYILDSGTPVFSETKKATSSSTAVTITNIPFNQVGTVTVVVTSVSKTSNTVTKTFKLVRK